MNRDAQLIALYLITNPHANMLGLYYLPVVTISHETGCSFDGASKGLRRVCEANFCGYDDKSEVVWVYEMARFQIGESLSAADKRCKGVQNEYESLPNNKFLQEFFTKYRAAFHMESARVLGRPLEGASKPHRSQEQEQEQEKTLSTANAVEVPGEAGSAMPACPHEKIIALYHELMPCNPRMLEWNETRKSHLRTRWREKAIPNGSSQGYATEEAGLAWWREFLGWLGQSKFLTGRAEGRNGGEPFIADLDWIVKPNNFAKAIEGKYHRGN